ncbi:hypothetical protein CUMW_084260 [Citrus unshiu]|nr:hypothetical protein CUMW_084260 [Citrus unshiu]
MSSRSRGIRGRQRLKRAGYPRRPGRGTRPCLGRLLPLRNRLQNRGLVDKFLHAGYLQFRIHDPHLFMIQGEQHPPPSSFFIKSSLVALNSIRGHVSTQASPPIAVIALQSFYLFDKLILGETDAFGPALLTLRPI